MAGLAYALNGLTFNCVMWTSNLAALSWLPLVMLCVERAWREGGRRIVPAVFVGALQMLSGAPEIILLTWFLVGTLWLGQAWGKSTPLAASASRLALIVALISALAAVQLLPVFELLQQSDRDPGRGNGAWAMPSWGWANLLVPLFRCSRSILGPYFQVEQQWTSSYYLGIGVVALATVAVWKAGTLRVWWLAFAALFGLGLALGENGVLHRLVKPIFPALELARYPIKFVVPTVFAFPMLAAFGAKWAQGGKGEAAEKTTREPLSLALSPPRGEGIFGAADAGAEVPAGGTPASPADATSALLWGWNPRPALKSSPNNRRPMELNSNSISSALSFSSSRGCALSLSNSTGHGAS